MLLMTGNVDCPPKRRGDILCQYAIYRRAYGWFNGFQKLASKTLIRSSTSVEEHFSIIHRFERQLYES